MWVCTAAFPALFPLQRWREVPTLAGSVNPGLADLRGRLDGIQAALARAAERAGRDPHGVRLVAVVKQVAAERVRAAVELGVTELGENRVQEAEGKIAAVGRAGLRWHMIGHLQRNKAGRAVELFDRIQSVDRLELAEAISRRAVALGRVVPVQIEVNVSGEATKFGVASGELAELARAISRLPGVRLDGLMTIGAPVQEPEAARPGFARLRRLRDQTQQALGAALPELSMGMSGDYTVAVEEGATMVRIGTALFGARESTEDTSCS
jgi:pyridoxal phosphate enzyme (YggS family)